ncbi:MAG: hypothetical protein M1817_003325 [Caeruleum heppii]|nr:MAG: hypothetical protein M1817_003325 [Caeruleum heppii]
MRDLGSSPTSPGVIVGLADDVGPIIAEDMAMAGSTAGPDLVNEGDMAENSTDTADGFLGNATADDMGCMEVTMGVEAIRVMVLMVATTLINTNKA